jgi:hypothetical protein
MNTAIINVSAELMKNYKAAELMSPENKFEALQTNIGNSLLFSIGTDDVFYVTQEKTDHSTGWQKTDISSVQITKSFPNKTGLICKTFEAAQSVVDGTIGLAMVINDGVYDHLFLSLSNDNTDTTWINNPDWIHFPFDNPVKNICIANVLISETINNTQYIVVDVLRDPASVEKLISRYYINTTDTTKPAWQPHDVSVDIEANSYFSCLGRQYYTNSPHQPTIDGLYTFGLIDGNTQFIFQPLYNVFNPLLPAASARLQLPNNLMPDSMAACRKADMSTDLYVCSMGGLYYFASSNQNDNDCATLLFENTMFVGVRKMYAIQQNGNVVIWGLNAEDEIFYTTCPITEELSNPIMWSYPLPIITGVDMFSPYINSANTSNTFFAVADNTLQKLTKSPQNTTWQTQSITLPALANANPQKYSSYTTIAQVTTDNNLPIPNTVVLVSAHTRVAVYINHLYYVLDTIPIQINTDQSGNITIVEWINNIRGTQLNFSLEDGKVCTLNPMDKPFIKMTSLNTADSLKNATVTNADGSKEPLVNGNVSQSDLETVAKQNEQLGKIYKNFPNAIPSYENRLYEHTIQQRSFTLNGVDAILVDAGDLFHWLASGIEAEIQIIQDGVSELWHFVASIAGKVYACILDCVEKVVGALEWIYNLIKTAIEKLIQFLEFLFEWNDILVTHRVIKNVITLFAQKSIDSLCDYKEDIIEAFQSIKNDISNWSNLATLDDSVNSAMAANTPLAGISSAPANVGIHHFQGNVANANSNINPPTIDVTIFQDLITLMENEENSIIEMIDLIKTEIIDQFDSLTITEIIQKILAITANFITETAENIIVAIIELFIQLTKDLMEFLTEKIDIPVLSWLYKDISGNDLSVLDLMCLISAIPVTIVYKIAASIAPFKEGEAFTDGLLSANNFQQLQNLFFINNSFVENKFTNSASNVLDEDKLKIVAFTTSILAYAGALCLFSITVIQRGSNDIAENLKTFALISAVSNTFYISPNLGSIINFESATWDVKLDNSLTIISFAKGFINISLANCEAGSKLVGISSFIETVINAVWNTPVIANIITNKDACKTTYKSLGSESAGNFAFNVGGMLELPIFFSRNEKRIQAVLCSAQYLLMVTYGILMPISNFIYAFDIDPKQTHE